MTGRSVIFIVYQPLTKDNQLVRKLVYQLDDNYIQHIQQLRQEKPVTGILLTFDEWINW